MSKDWTKIESETIDWLRPVMAFMVICLQTQLFYVDELWSINGGLFDVFIIYLCKVICPIAVPSFFFISGYLFFKGLEDWNHQVWKRKMTKRIKTLLVPFILWNLIAFIAFPLTRYAGSVMKGVPMESIADVIQDRGFLRLFWDRTLFDGNTHNYTTILGWSVPCGQPMDTPMWFVRDLMVVMLFTPLIHWLLKKSGYLIVTILGLLFIINIWIPVSGFGIKATFFFTWGSFYSVKGRNFILSFSNIKIPAAILFLAGLAVVPFIWDNHPQLFNYQENLFIIIATVFFFNTISWLIDKGRIHINTRLTSSSFFIYCSHMVIIASAVMWLVMLPSFQSGAMRTLLFLAGSVMIFTICHYIYLFLDRFLPSVSGILTGGRNNK